MVANNSKSRKIGIIDVAILVAILAVVVGVGYRYVKGKAASSNTVKTQDLIIEYYCEEVPESAAKAIKVGDPVRESLQNASFGNVTDIVVDKSVSWARNIKGELVKTTREGYASVTITMNGKGVIGSNGVTIDKANYYVGQTVTLYVGNSMISNGRISDIKIKE
ncbi:MAG TPA: DUF4330 domain-containing protein [Clostridiaceae bacterium]|nr:DUF4330 domain-containing protein [Clostridiaceae bacterium]